MFQNETVLVIEQDMADTSGRDRCDGHVSAGGVFFRDQQLSQAKIDLAGTEFEAFVTNFFKKWPDARLFFGGGCIGERIVCLASHELFDDACLCCAPFGVVQFQFDTGVYQRSRADVRQIQSVAWRSAGCRQPRRWN